MTRAAKTVKETCISSVSCVEVYFVLINTPHFEYARSLARSYQRVAIQLKITNGHKFN